jgi:acyl-CoA thioesterase
VAEESVSLAERVVAVMLLEDRATVAMGMRVESVDAGTACVTMEVRDDMLNGFATCHGGLLFSLADSAFGFASNSRNLRAVAAGCQIDYLRPALAGDKLRATAIERSSGKRLGLYDVTIINQHEETVALFRGRSCWISGSVVNESADPPQQS